MLNKFKASLYVFDDLERCEMPINKTLGYINEFVEHDGCKVIIIANEMEITEKDEYRRRREKLIGQTLEVQSAFDEALVYFTALINCAPTKSFFVAKCGEISSIYQESGLNNLRILQQTMWDFERVHRVLTVEHHRNDSAMTTLLQLIFALSFEVKAGRLGADDLIRRANRFTVAMIERHGDGERSAFVAAHKRYTNIDLGDTMLTDEVLIDILVKGIVDEHEVQAVLNRSVYFAANEDEPAWITVWNVFERTNEEFNVALSQIERGFVERKFSAVGEVLQVFGLRLWLASIGVLVKERPDVASECKHYIDDLYASGRLEPISGDRFEGLRAFIGVGGYGIREFEAADFQELYAYLKDRGNAADEARYPEQAAELLQEMKADGDLFFRRLNFTQDGEENRYHSVPILAVVEPDIFVSTFLTLHPKLQRSVLVAFQARYDLNRLQSILARERPWLESVRDKLVAAAETMPLIGRYRLKTIVEATLGPVLGKEAGKEP